MKKLLKCTLAVGISLLTFTVANATLEAPTAQAAKFDSIPANTYAKVLQTANIRSGKGKQYKVLGTIKKGKYIKVYKVYYNDKESWAQVKYKGKKAYISMKLLYINAG